jgi:hypothetical protein
MKSLYLPFLCAVLFAGAACGHKIGDSCTVSSDCSSDGTRVCDTFSPGGSCTIEGCDFGTCPDEAVCVRFFPALQNAPDCKTAACQPDEICTVGGLCAPRSIELRFCMLKCEDNGDCRDGYECRRKNLMILHGGEPVPDPDKPMPDAGPPTEDDPLQGFCAGRKPCLFDTDCDDDYVCDSDSRLCYPPGSKPEKPASSI